MNNIISFEEHRKRRNKPLFYDLDKVMAQREIAIKKHMIAMARLRKYCEAEK